MFHNLKDPWVRIVSDPIYGDSAVALREYLQFMDESESPREYHMWSLLSLASATLRRRCWINLGGVGTIIPNQYIVLVGPPAARKSSALTAAEQFYWAAGVRIGPNDTAGQRHGLMMAFQGTRRFPANALRVQNLMTVPKSVDDLANLDTDAIVATLPRETLDRDLYLVSKELGRLIMNQDRGMIDFLTDVYDGESIDYQTKHGSTKIHKPSLNLIGATTPTSLANCLPKGASDHGILSRIIFVYASDSYRSLPRPKAHDSVKLELRDRLVERLEAMSKLEGAFIETQDAASLYDQLHAYQPKILDARFNGYGGRRSTHLRKLALAIAALRADGKQEIALTDMQLAHALLSQTEVLMAQSLLALGGSQLHLGKYLMIELLRSQGSATLDELYRVAATELKQSECKQAVEELMQHKILIGLDSHRFALREVIHTHSPRSSSQSGGQEPHTPESA